VGRKVNSMGRAMRGTRHAIGVLTLLAESVHVLLAAPAQSATVSVHTSPDSLTVGDPVTVEVRVEAAAGDVVTFPRPQTPAQVEVVNLETPPAEAGTWMGRYTLSVFDVGDIVLPPWSVQVQTDTQTAIVYTDSIRLHVASVLDDSLAAADIRPLKAQQELPVPLPLWIWFALAAVVLALALFLWHRRRRRRRVVIAPAAPAIAPHEAALVELRKLEAQQLPASGRIKEHYVRLSEILRQYLEAAPQFGFTALEETTDEIRRELRARGYKPQLVQTLLALCEEADLVKFAKMQPTILECDAALDRVRRFVNETARTSLLQLRESEVAEVVAT